MAFLFVGQGAPERIDEEMNRFLDWFNSDAHHGYVKSAIAHLWFVCIHPFDDGNGRIGRAIADMALSQAENSKMRFFSISQQINKDKKQYYDILEKTQKGDCEITEWIIWYLDCLLRSVEQSDETLSKVLDKTIFWQTHAETVLSERQREVLNLYLDGYPGKNDSLHDQSIHTHPKNETNSVLPAFVGRPRPFAVLQRGKSNKRCEGTMRPRIRLRPFLIRIHPQFQMPV